MTVLDTVGRRAEPLLLYARQVRDRVPGLPRARAVVATVSPVGWGLLASAAVAGWAGAALDWSELQVFSYAAIGALLAAVGFTWGRSTYAVLLDLNATRVVVGERAIGRLLVTNDGSRRVRAARIELPVGANAAGFDLPALSAGEEHDELFAVPTDRRALIVVGPVRSSRGDALGLLRREVRWTAPVDLYVHPRTVRLEGSGAGFVRDLEGRPSRELSNSDVSFHALRPYVPGDDRRYVHWKSSAKTGTWMVRQFEETRRSHIVVSLTTATADYADDEQFELGVSAGASLGLQALRDEKTLTVLTSSGRLRILDGPRLLDDLTTVTTSGRAAGLSRLARSTSQQVLDATVVVLVCGTTSSPGDLRAASAQFGQDVRVVVVRCAPQEQPSYRTVGTGTVITISTLSDLPAAVRRAGTL